MRERGEYRPAVQTVIVLGVALVSSLTWLLAAAASGCAWGFWLTPWFVAVGFGAGTAIADHNWRVALAGAAVGLGLASFGEMLLLSGAP